MNTTGAVSGVIGTTSAPAIGTAADGYVFTATGAGVNPAWEAASSGGGLVHILTAVLPTGATNTSTTFDNFYNSSYTSYHVVMRDVEIANDAVGVRFNFNKTSDQSVEGGAGYWAAINGYKHTGAVYNASNVNDTHSNLTPNLGNATGEAMNCALTVSGMQNSAVYAGYSGPIMWSHGSDYIVSAVTSAIYQANPATSFSGFTISTQSGNFAGGSISVYGYATS